MYRRGNRRGNKKITTGYLKELSSINVSDGFKDQTSVETRRLHLDEGNTPQKCRYEAIHSTFCGVFLSFCRLLG